MVLSRKHTDHKVETDSRDSITTGKAKKTSKKNAVLKEQIQLLGGTAEDYELVRDADEDMDSGSIAVDASITKSSFVIIFLNRLHRQHLQMRFPSF